jgi:hypothetical protein
MSGIRTHNVSCIAIHTFWICINFAIVVVGMSFM